MKRMTAVLGALVTAVAIAGAVHAQPTKPMPHIAYVWLFDLPSMHRRAADMTDKVLKGAKPGDIPFEIPSKLELVVNVKVAKALGVTIPPELIARADEVIR
jgi:hypothetical protein